MPGPATEKYKCPVKNCKTEPRGDDVTKHFHNSANLKALDRAVANQSTLRKTLSFAPGNVWKYHNLLVQFYNFSQDIYTFLYLVLAC